MAGKRKTPKAEVRPQDKKRPVAAATPPEPTIEGHPLSWRFYGADRSGPFSWGALVDPGKYKEVIERLSELEQKTWAQIKQGGNHSIEVSRLGKAARDRLIQIKKDDIDELMSIRITGANRVWVIRRPGSLHIMRVLWWDPDHTVYKTERDRADRRKRHRRG